MTRDHNQLEELALIVCDVFGITKNELIGLKNYHVPTEARGCFLKICKDQKISIWPYISDFLGRSEDSSYQIAQLYEKRIKWILSATRRERVGFMDASVYTRLSESERRFRAGEVFKKEIEIESVM